MSEKRFIIVKSIENLYAIVDKERADKEQILILSLHKEQVGVVCDLLNEQQATIEMYQRSVDKREEQISIIKKYCLKFLTDEQFETIRMALEDE